MRATRLRRPIARLRVSALLVVALLVAALVPAPPAVAATTWTKNLFVSKAFLYQDPYYTACTAASVMHMLNTMAYRGTGGHGFTWTPTRIKRDANLANVRDMTSILSFERRYDTLRSTSAGSDAHGWRNALNYYGWGAAAMKDPAARVYEDRAFGSLGSAMKAAVRAIARFGKPVGLLAWAGGHAQVMTGYVVTGEDPALSSNFTIAAVYLSDPLLDSAIVNRKVSYTSLKEGSLHVRFQAYRETDSPYDDPYSGGWIRSAVKPTVASSEWYHRWVLLLPVRAGLPEAPPPDPTPSPDPTPTPDPSASASPSTAPDASPTASASAGPSPASASTSADATPAPAPPSPTASPQPTPAPTPTPTPTPAPTTAPTPGASPTGSASPTP